MGGKKKKSAEPATPAAGAGRTGAAASGNGVAEEAKKQPAKLAKESKSKGGISLIGWKRHCGLADAQGLCLLRLKQAVVGLVTSNTLILSSC